MSRVTKLMKTPRRRFRRSARVLRNRALRAMFGPGVLYLNGVRLGVVTSITYNPGSGCQDVPMTFEPVSGTFAPVSKLADGTSSRTDIKGPR